MRKEEMVNIIKKPRTAIRCKALMQTSHVGMELVSNVSENICASIITD
jgi:hypothetical protein